MDIYIFTVYIYIYCLYIYIHTILPPFFKPILEQPVRNQPSRIFLFFRGSLELTRISLHGWKAVMWVLIGYGLLQVVQIEWIVLQIWMWLYSRHRHGDLGGFFPLAFYFKQIQQTCWFFTLAGKDKRSNQTNEWKHFLKKELHLETPQHAPYALHHAVKMWGPMVPLVISEISPGPVCLKNLIRKQISKQRGI